MTDTLDLYAGVALTCVGLVAIVVGVLELWVGTGPITLAAFVSIGGTVCAASGPILAMRGVERSDRRDQWEAT